MHHHYYNEFDPNAAQWLRNLGEAGEIPEGVVDERSIKEVDGGDLEEAVQAHFFAGIGGWPLALRLAGWDPTKNVWTGSCPCQPYSSAGKQEGDADPRNLWPDFFRLIRERRPATVFGEQVASAIKHGWLDRVFSDLEGIGYTCGAAVLGAHSVGANHIRQRLYWGAALEGLGNGIEADSKRRTDERRRDAMGRIIETVAERKPGHDGPDGSGIARGLSNNNNNNNKGLEVGGEGRPEPGRRAVIGPDGDAGGLPDDALDRRIEGRTDAGGSGAGAGAEAEATGRTAERGDVRTPWSDFRYILCTDGKARRTGARVFPLAHGLPRGVGQGGAWRKGLVRSASRARIGMLKGSGNAIVPELAAVFIKAFMEVNRA